MTTVIACRPQLTMVSDSRVSHGDGRFISRKKIQKSGNYIAGVAGDYPPALKFLKAFLDATREMDGKTVPNMPAFEGEFELMVLSLHGLWIYGGDGTPIEVEEDIYTIGSGGSYASVCLATQARLGQPANLQMALDIACEYDSCSGPPMVEMSLKRKKSDDLGRTADKTRKT